MKGRKRGRREEAPPPVGGARRGACSRPRPRGRTTAVRKVWRGPQFLFGCFDWPRLTGVSVCPGSQERKLQRRSVRSRSESERGSDPIPKKKTKKEQVAVLLCSDARLHFVFPLPC